MKTGKQIMVVLGVVAVALFAGQAQAVFVDHSVSGQIFDSNGFENQPGANVSSLAGFETPGDFLPNNGGKVGDWRNNTIQAGQDQSVQVTDNTTTPPGGALYGDNFLRINGWGPVWAITVAEFAQQTNGTLTVEFDAYVKSNPSNTAHSFFGLMTDPGDFNTRFFRLGIDSTNGQVFQQEGGGTTNLPLSITLDTWQNYELVADLTNQTYSISVDGGTAGTSSWGGGINTARGLFFYGNGGGDGSNGVLYLDGIPEPATMALLGLGGLMVLRRRRSA